MWCISHPFIALRTAKRNCLRKRQFLTLARLRLSRPMGAYGRLLEALRDGRRPPSGRTRPDLGPPAAVPANFGLG